MSFYSKISLFALLAAGSLIGMEQPPRLKHPATSAAAQAINQPMIKVFSETGQIDSIPRNYLEASETLNNMLEEVGADHALVLPESMIEDYLAIKDLLIYEYRFKMETIDEKTVADILKPKTEQQLVSILNACHRFECNKVIECAVTVLATKLNASKRKEQCLKDGSYNLHWTPDVARLVAQQMVQNDIANKTMSLIYWLAQATLNKNGRITFQDLNYIDSNAAQYSFTHLLEFFPSPAVAHIGPLAIVKAPQRSVFENMFIVPFIALSENEQQTIKSYLQQAYGNDTYNRTYLPRLKYSVVEKYPADYNTPARRLGFYYIYSQELQNHINKRLTPEELVVLEYCFNCKKERNEYDFVSYPGLERLNRVLSPELKTLIFPNWWQRRSWLSKAAIFAGGVAATGLAAWYGYKYFSKK